jgi:hypothetical protein
MPRSRIQLISVCRRKRGLTYGLLLAHAAFTAVFFISVLLAVLAFLVRYAHIAIPVVSHYTFETLLVAFLLVLAGNLFKGF